MPLAGSLDIRPLVDGAPEVVLSDRELEVDDVDILQVLYEIRVADREALVPPALNPTIPPVISFLVYRAKESVFGPFALAQLRLTARSGVRPRALPDLGPLRQPGSWPRCWPTRGDSGSPRGTSACAASTTGWTARCTRTAG